MAELNQLDRAKVLEARSKKFAVAIEAQVVDATRIAALRQECGELLKIFASSLATAKANR